MNRGDDGVRGLVNCQTNCKLFRYHDTNPCGPRPKTLTWIDDAPKDSFKCAALHRDGIPLQENRIGGTAIQRQSKSMSTVGTAKVFQSNHFLLERLNLLGVGIGKSELRHQSFLPPADHEQPFGRVLTKELLTINERPTRGIRIRLLPLFLGNRWESGEWASALNRGLPAALEWDSRCRGWIRNCRTRPTSTFPRLEVSQQNHRRDRKGHRTGCGSVEPRRCSNQERLSMSISRRTTIFPQ